ncbi:MAG: hypothetical protein Q9157_004164 [Trypethelium eluteriae]
MALAALLNSIVATTGQAVGSGLFLFPSGQAGDPQPGLTLNYNDILISSWISQLQGSVDLILYGSDVSGTGFAILMNTSVPAIGTHQISFTSIATTTRNWPVGAHLSLQAREEKDGFDSHSFNVTSRDVPPRTLMATAPSPSSVLLTPTSMIASASSGLPTDKSASPTGRGGKNSTHTGHRHHGFSTEDDRRSHHHRASGLSGGAIAGITIGVIAGGVAMLMPAICFHLRRRRSKRELAIKEAGAPPSLPPTVPPKVSSGSDLPHDLSVSSHGSNMRKPSNASSTTIVVGLAPSRRPTETSSSLARPSTPTIHELYASGQMINEMPATPVKIRSETSSKDIEKLRSSVQVYEIDSENAILEEEIYKRLKS